MSDKLTKEEVEEKLRSKGEDISNRFESIESHIPGRKNPIVIAFRDKKSLKIGLAVGAGLLVGLFLFRSRSGRGQPDYGDGLDGLSGKLGRRISDMLKTAKMWTRRSEGHFANIHPSFSTVLERRVSSQEL